MCGASDLSRCHGCDQDLDCFSDFESGIHNLSNVMIASTFYNWHNASCRRRRRWSWFYNYLGGEWAGNTGALYKTGPELALIPANAQRLQCLQQEASNALPARGGRCFFMLPCAGAGV